MCGEMNGDGATIESRTWAMPPSQDERRYSMCNNIKCMGHDAPDTLETFQQALAYAVMDAWSWDLATNTVSRSGDSCRVIGPPPLNHISDLWDRLHPEDHDRVKEHMLGAIRGEHEYDWTGRAQSGDGYIWVRSVGKVIRDDEGNPVKVAGVVRDITKEIELEQELRRKTEELEMMNRRKDEFLAVLAHEMRSPLAPIKHCLYYLKHTGTQTSGERDTTEVIERQVDRLASLVNDLMDLTAIGQGKLSFRPERVLVCEIMQRAVETVQPVMDQHNHKLTISFPPKNGTNIYADPVRLEQVFVNLLTNAAKYTPQGGTIHFYNEISDGKVRIGVRDSGAGIPADAITHLFDMFHQTDHVANRRKGGLGIGLSLCKRIVDHLGGTIAAESEGVDKGSVFTVELPNHQDVETNSLNILVVEDNEDSANTLAKILTLYGHNVQVAMTGRKALAMVDENPPHLILCDIGLPDISGLDVAIHVRDRHPSVVLCALTGYGNPNEAAQQEAAGFKYRFVKPIHMDRLQHFLRSFCV